jgi:PAS domain S-box-containing protein
MSPLPKELVTSNLFCLYVMGVDQKRIEMSQAAKTLTGFDSEDADAFHKNINEADKNAHADLLQSALLTRGNFKTTYRYKKPDGSIIVIEEKGVVILNHNQEPTSFVCSLTDITIQEKLKEDFQAALGMAKFPLENPLPVFRADKNGKLMFANKSSVDMLKSLGLSAGIITDPGFLRVLKETIQTGKKGNYILQIFSDKVFSLNIVPQVSDYANVYTSDISESVQLQEILQDKLSDLSTVLDSTDELILLINEKLEIRSVNKTFRQSISSALTIEFKENTNLELLQRHSFYPKFVHAINVCFMDGTTSSMELTIESNKGVFDHFSVSINPVRKRGTNIISSVCIRIKDVTANIVNIEKLKSQKNLYESILDNIPADIAIFDEDHRYLYVNPSGIKDKNLRQWIIGKTDFDYCAFRNIDTRIANERRDMFQDVLKNKREHEIESFHQKKDGTVIHYLRRFHPYYENGEFKMMIGYGIDVTDIKNSQLQLKVNEERYKTLFESNPLPVLVMDLNGNIVSANSALLKETGFAPADVIGHNIQILLSDKARSAFPEWVMEYKKDPDTYYQREIKVRNSNGMLLDFEITLKKFDWDLHTSHIFIVANNITERKVNARLLEESERLNRRLLQELPVSVVTVVQGIITHANNSFFKLVSADENDVIENPLSKWVHEEDRSTLEKTSYDLFTGKDSVEYRIRIRTASNEIRFVDVRESIFELKKNMVTLALITDVTEKVAIEDRNKEIEARTKKIIESALDGIVLTDNQLQIIDWNSKCADIFKWGKKNLQGVSLKGFFKANDSSALLKKGLFETTATRSDSEPFPVEIFSASLNSGNKELLVYYIRDITERVTTQNKLRETERIEHILNQFSAEIYQLEEVSDIFNKMIATFHTICDLCHISVFQTDENGNELQKLEGVGESFRLPVWNENTLVPSTKTDIVRQAMSACTMIIRTGVDDGMEKSDLAVPLMVSGKNWGVVRFETGFTGLFSEGNQGIIKKMLEATSVRLSKVIDDQKLRRLNRELVQNNAQLQQYSYIVSHNLRAPIANLLGLSRLFNTNNLSDERNVKVIRNIESSAFNIDSILKDLNKILAIRKELSKEKEEVSLDDIIYQVLKTLEKEFIEVRPRIDLDMKVTRLLTIKSYITSIFTNLISNAIKYRAPERECEIVIRTFNSDRGITIEFEDNGMGMDMDKFGEQIFGLYKRYHRHVEGTGIGLHLVKSQVEAMNGKISVQSIINKGTKFTIQLYHD